MEWIDEAVKYTTRPVALVEVDFSVTDTRKYSVDYIRPQNSTKYKGNILNLPRIYQSIGDIKRSFETSRIEIIFADNDREFRTIVQSQAIKNKEVRIKMSFPCRSLATESYVIFTGWIYDYELVDNFRFRMICENILPSLDNEYPEKRVEETDFPNADESAIGWIIPNPYGTISNIGLSGAGAYGHPSLTVSGGGGMLLVDNRLDQEISLVGRQGSEMLTNGEFTADISGWGVLSSAILASVTGGKSGKCLRITANGGTNPGAYQDITVIPGHWYYSECYVKAGTEDEYSFEIYNRDDTSYIYDSGTLTAAGDWSTRALKLWQAPEGCTTASVFIRSSAAGGSGKTFFVDTVITYEAIYVDKVYLDADLKTEGLGNDYTISYEVVSDHLHCLIEWEAGVNPTRFNRASADIVFGSRRPVEMIRHYLENFCDYDPDRFDATTYDIATEMEANRGYTAGGALWKSNKALQSILDDWRGEFELEIFVNKAGKIVFKYISAIIGTPSTYTDVLDIHPGFKMQAKVDELLNSLKYGYNYNYSGTYYGSYATYEDTVSQTKYGQTYLKFQGFSWIRTAQMARDIASRKILRFKDPITFYTLRLPLRSFVKDLAEVIKISHYLGAGASGFTDKLCQIKSMELDIDKFTNTVRLEDASNFMGRACILGDEFLLPPKWTDATPEQQDYLYLCDETLGEGEFSDGQPGKRMFD